MSARMAEGDTVVVSGAAGATGSAVGQIAKLSGAAKVVGLAGTDEKCRWIVDELGFDEAINYKSEPVAQRLHAACPRGIDLYFDNVGGEILDACLAQIALRGRVVLCGAISTYNAEGKVAGPGNYRALIARRGRMEGFIILDYVSRFPEAQAAMFGLVGRRASCARPNTSSTAWSPLPMRSTSSSPAATPARSSWRCDLDQPRHDHIGDLRADQLVPLQQRVAQGFHHVGVVGDDLTGHLA